MLPMRPVAPVAAPGISAIFANFNRNKRSVALDLKTEAAGFSLSEHMSAATFEADGKVGYVRVLSRGRRPYKTRDGWVGVLPYSERNWTRILTEIGRADVVAEPWFRNATERSRRVDELYEMLAAAMPSRTSAEWLATFERLDLPHSPLRTPQDMLVDEHLNDVDFFACNFAGATPVKRTLRQPVNVEDVATTPDLPPPPLGADTEAVLREAGCSEAEIAAALRTGKG